LKTQILIAGDLHCGHLLGLTPPEEMRRFVLSKLMEDFWNFWETNTSDKFDIAFWMGDLIEGEGKRDSSHLLLPCIDDQVDLAVNIISRLNIKRHVFVYGTPYHVSNNSDYERYIAENFGGDIKTTQKKIIDGIKFDISHKVGKSGSIAGGDSILKNEMLWAYINDNVDYVIRGHAHEYRLEELDFLTGIICPALKICYPDLDRYGRGLKGWYTVGFLKMIIEDGVANISKHFFRYKLNRMETIE